MKNRSAIILLLGANAISGFAQGISMLAIPWYFADVLKSESLFGIAYASFTFISIFWSLYSGTLIDRYPRKNIFLGICGIGGLIVGTIALYGYIFEALPVALIIAVFGTTLLIYNVHYPTVYAFLQELSERSNYGRISSMIEVQGQATSVLAGAVAAILLSGTDGSAINMMGIKITLPIEIEKWNIYEIFMIDALTYFIAFVLILMIKYETLEKLEIHTGPIKERIKTGVNFLKQRSLLFSFGNASYSIFVVLMVEVFLLLPMYVSNHLEEKADVYASAEIFYSIGALFAGLSIRALFKKTNTIKAIIYLMVFTILGFALCTFTKSVAVFFIFSVLIGITNAGARVLRITFLYDHIPNNIMGRAGSVFHIINIASRGFFILLFSIPFFSKSNNVIWAYGICGLFLLVMLYPLIKNYKALTSLKGNY
jgi:MFS transporter, DHA3 family, macrolide efflux protein